MNAADEARVREIVREELQARDPGRCEAYRALTKSDLAGLERFSDAIREVAEEVVRDRSAQAPAGWQRVRGWVRAVTGWWQR